jgi:AraC-like DNA-binding protein
MLDSIHIRLIFYRFLELEPVRWRFATLQSNFWRFYMNDRDGALLEREDGPYALQKGRLYIIPAGVPFGTKLMQPVGHLFVHFDVQGLPGIVRSEIFSSPICLPPLPDLEQSVWLIRQELQQATGVALLQQFRIKAILYAGLTHYLQQLPYEQLVHYSQLAIDLEPVLPAIQHIETHLSGQLLSRDLAQLCHMNPDYFTRRFRECVGQTPGQYIQEQRIKRAEQQLLLTKESIEQIAANNGFGSRAYLSRVFTRHTGVSPAAYRKLQYPNSRP